MQGAGSFHFNSEFSVGSFQVHPNGKLRMSSLADFFQEVAWRHADSADFGRNLLENNLSWILSRFDIKATNLPTWGDSIKVFTAGRGVDKLFAYREFLITDLQGNPLATAMSSWVLLNTQTQKLQRPNEVLPAELFTINQKPDWQPDRIRFSGEIIFEEVLKVRYSDLDLNNHVNNTTYIRWVEDLLNDYQIEASHLLINYLAECILGDQVRLVLYQSDGKYQIHGKVLDKSVFLAETIV